MKLRVFTSFDLNMNYQKKMHSEFARRGLCRMLRKGIAGSRNIRVYEICKTKAICEAFCHLGIGTKNYFSHCALAAGVRSASSTTNNIIEIVRWTELIIAAMDSVITPSEMFFFTRKSQCCVFATAILPMPYRCANRFRTIFNAKYGTQIMYL